MKFLRQSSDSLLTHIPNIHSGRSHAAINIIMLGVKLFVEFRKRFIYPFLGLICLTSSEAWFSLYDFNKLMSPYSLSHPNKCIMSDPSYTQE